MTGVFGFDPQRTRSMVALAEDGGAATPQALGDGRRLLVPNAAEPAGRWASAAAEAVLAADADAPLAERFDAWATDPLAVPFLEGLQRRLRAYLGGTEPTNRHGYHLSMVSAAPGRGPAERAAAVGLTSVETVHPTDALLCRWLADPRTPAVLDTTVLAIACGEAATWTAGYRVDRSPDGIRVEEVPGTQDEVPVGLGAVTAAVAHAVHERCGEGVTTADLLALSDGAWEFGAELDAGSPGAEVTWDGPLAERMFAPLRLTAAAVTAWPAVTSWRSATADLLARLARLSGANPWAVVGGLGAVWPAAADVVGRAVSGAAVWRSHSPEQDLARGAALWPALRVRLAPRRRDVVPQARPGGVPARPP